LLAKKKSHGTNDLSIFSSSFRAKNPCVKLPEKTRRILMRLLKPAGLVLVSFLMGVAVTRYYDTHRAAPQPSATAKAPEQPATTQVVQIDFQNEPLWAYGFEEPAKPGDTAPAQNPPTRNLRPNEDPVEQTRLRHVVGSTAAYSLVDVRDGQNVIDWFPSEHPLMPNVIAHGPAALKEKRRGCGSCHLPTGKGRPENAPVAGLPVPYIMRQLQDFRSGKRHSADPRKPNTFTMIELAKSLSDEELKAAAEYFSSMKWWPWTRVVETDLVPKTRINGNLFLAIEKEKTQPIA
jgi:cytochrome c553